MVNKKRLLDLFLRLVQIDSISRKERKMADILTEELLKLKTRVWEDNSANIIGGEAGNVIAYIEGDKEYPYFLLSAHMDRVKPGIGIKPVIRDSYIYSQGKTVLAGDDLIGVSVILEVINLLRENKIPHGPIKIVFSVAEEIGLLGAKNLNKDELKGIDYGLVLDAEGEIGSIIYKAPSQLKFNVYIRGKAAHAGMNPDSGINAIKIASQAISNIKLGRIDEETTANIGVIKGGIAINIIPDLVVLEGEVRSHSESKLKEQIDAMKFIIDKAVNKYHGKVDFKIERLYSSYSLEKNNRFMNLISYCANELGIKMQYNISGGGSDANIFNNIGLPCLNLAVGMENVHTSEERVKIDNLVLIAEYLYLILKNSRRLK
jgi:tripeptide aminopeptidase